MAGKAVLAMAVSSEAMPTPIATDSMAQWRAAPSNPSGIACWVGCVMGKSDRNKLKGNILLQMLQLCWRRSNFSTLSPKQTDLKRFFQISTLAVDKVVGKPLLTAQNACNDKVSNKMPNQKAHFYPNKINDLQKGFLRLQGSGQVLENFFSVHK
jgi:hypothetical protein